MINKRDFFIFAEFCHSTRMFLLCIYNCRLVKTSFAGQVTPKEVAGGRRQPLGEHDVE